MEETGVPFPRRELECVVIEVILDGNGQIWPTQQIVDVELRFYFLRCHESHGTDQYVVVRDEGEIAYTCPADGLKSKVNTC